MFEISVNVISLHHFSSLPFTRGWFSSNNLFHFSSVKLPLFFNFLRLLKSLDSKNINFTFCQIEESSVDSNRTRLNNLTYVTSFFLHFEKFSNCGWNSCSYDRLKRKLNKVLFQLKKKKSNLYISNMQTLLIHHVGILFYKNPNLVTQSEQKSIFVSTESQWIY